MVQLDEGIRELLVEVGRIIVIEFIEVAVPLYYAGYTLVLFHLPNAKYYPEMRYLKAAGLARSVRNITIYAMFELVSMLSLHLFLRQKLKISALHMLSSVLERDNAVLQGVFIVWVVIVLEFSLEHAGSSCSTLFD